MNAYQVPADPTAVMGRRIVAWLIDLVLLAILFVALVALLADHVKYQSHAIANLACDAARASKSSPVLCGSIGRHAWATQGGASLGVIFGALGFVVLNKILLEGATGGSIGKQVVGLRVVRQDSGTVCGIGKAFVRTLVGIVDNICAGLVGLITALASKGHRRVGDMAASTLVVSATAVGRPPVVPGLTTTAPIVPPYGEYPPPAAPGAYPPPANPPWGVPPVPPAPDRWTPSPAPAPAPEPESSRAAAPITSVFDAPAVTPPVPPAPAPDAPGYPPEPEPATAPAPRAEPTPTPTPTPTPSEAPAAAAPTATAATTHDTAAMPGVGAPTWDSARNAYIQWDPELGQWMQWSDAVGQWRPIS